MHVHVFPDRRRALAMLLALASSLMMATHHNVSAANASDRDLAIRQALYRKQLAEYRSARAAYDEYAAPYWASIATKRSQRRARRSFSNIAARDYILRQPPLYSGPPQPKNPDGSPPPEKYVPVVADFLRAAKEQFDFVPDTPATENDFKRAYGAAARAAGLTRAQCVRIYAFESGGDGAYDVQAGLEYRTPGARAITTALGYNQLLSTNSVELVAEAGNEFLTALEHKAATSHGARQDALKGKIRVLKKMISFSRSVPDRWIDHARLAEMPKGLAIHALNLDIDIGPLLQTRKLLTSVEFAKRHGFEAPLSAAELEMMNLTGDGSGFEMVLMPQELRRKIPTSNFFQRGGYERNPVASINDTVARLITATDSKMDSEMKLAGAQAMAAIFERFQSAR